VHGCNDECVLRSELQERQVGVSVRGGRPEIGRDGVNNALTKNKVERLSSKNDKGLHLNAAQRSTSSGKVRRAHRQLATRDRRHKSI